MAWEDNDEKGHFLDSHGVEHSSAGVSQLLKAKVTMEFKNLTHRELIHEIRREMQADKGRVNVHSFGCCYLTGEMKCFQ